MVDDVNGGSPVARDDMSVRVDAQAVGDFKVVCEAMFSRLVHHHDSRVIRGADVTIDVFNNIPRYAVQQFVMIIIFYRLHQFSELIKSHDSPVI